MSSNWAIHFFLLSLMCASLEIAAPRAVFAGVSPAPSADASASLDGRIIDSLIIDNRNVFNTEERHHDNFIYRMANKLRWVTKPWIIRNEVLFAVGDTFSSVLSEETARNLRSRVALYEAWVETDTLQNGHVVVSVRTIDQWSLRGGARLSREANETNYHIGLEDLNLFGRNEFLSLYYYVQERDRNFTAVTFRDQRAFGKPFSVTLDYSGHPLDGIRQIAIAKPCYNLLQRLSFNVTTGKHSGRRDQYIDDNRKSGESRYKADQTKLDIGYRFGSYRQKIGPLLAYKYLFETVRDTVTLLPDESVSFPSDSLYHQFGFGGRWSNLDFAVTRRIAGFSYTEDITLGQSLEVMFSRAYSQPFASALYDQLSWQVFAGARFGSNIALVTYDDSRSSKEGRNLRRVTNVTVRYFNNTLSYLTVALRARYIEDIRSHGQRGLVFGGLNDLRGYDRFFRTGERLAVLNIEGRFYPKLELLTAQFGGVLFIDAGTAWMRGHQSRWRDLYASIGAGLRIALDKIVKGDVIRIDIAHSRVHDWEIAIGTGQYF